MVEAIPVPRVSTRSKAVVLLFAAALFLSAFLLFSVEPIIAKALLPTLGGAPMVWNTCVAFFQLVLLGGYIYAHGAAAWLGKRRHVAVYVVLLALPFTVLPFATRVTSTPSPDASPIGWLLLALFGLIGLPFFVLSTSAAVLQVWFSKTDDPTARDPYFLYAASNLGSLLALVSYPAFVEPMLRLQDQSRVWAVGYSVFVGVSYLCAIVVLRTGTWSRDQPSPVISADAAVVHSERVSLRRRARWVALSFIPSSLMLAVTSYLSTDIAAVPLLWVVPLSLYLLTFVIAFGSRASAVSAFANRFLPLLILPLALTMAGQGRPNLWFAIPLHLIAFTMACLLCHSELARDRPQTSSLTDFYFCIALGGMFGGLFNTLAAPLLFSTVVEYPLILVLACLFRSRPAVSRVEGPVVETRAKQGLAIDVLVAVVVGAFAGGVIAGVRYFEADGRYALIGLGIPAFVAFTQSRRPMRFALSLGAILLAGTWASDGGQTLHTERTFFGVYRVSVEGSGRYRALFHGTTLHGMQATDRSRQADPLTYYHRTGPFGQAFTQLPNVSGAPEIAVVGLGVGSLATYATAGQRWTFYELDPAVERLARSAEYFTYMGKCADRCRVVLGDARISLASAKPNQYGLIVLDAFSSDAIPMHLMTSEAFTLYLSRLSHGGVLAFHISNRHLSLGPVVARLARLHGLTVLEQLDQVTAEESTNGKSASEWVFMAENPTDLGPLVADKRWVPPVVSDSTPLWTDDASSILSVLHFR
jgi:spermidine synthase